MYDERIILYPFIDYKKKETASLFIKQRLRQ